MSGTIDHCNVYLKIDSTLTKALDLSSLPIDPFFLQVSNLLSNGTATGLASQQWYDSRNLIASATEDIDFAGGVTNAFGVVVTFITLKVIFVRAATTNTNSVEVTRKATTGLPLFMADGDGISLAPGAWFIYASPTTGKTVTATTDDTLTFTNSAGGTAVDYDIFVAGTD
jgi:hypothetical protein